MELPISSGLNCNQKSTLGFYRCKKRPLRSTSNYFAELLLNALCGALNSGPQNYVQSLTPKTYECDLLEIGSLQR